MTLCIDEKGTIYINQGDSGDIVVTGLSTDKNYKVFFAVKNAKRETVGEELVVDSNCNPAVTFRLTSEFTDLFDVPVDEFFKVYYYGLKLCTESGDEDTLFVADSDYGILNNIIVYPKMVEGL